MGVKVTGGAEIIAKLRLYRERAQAAASAAAYQFGLKVMAASDSLVPVATGRLRASHYVMLPTPDGTVKLGYGVDYALPVHENLASHHEHGMAKFLELALDEWRPQAKAWIKAKTLENIRRGVGLEASGAVPASPEMAAVNAAHHEALAMNRAFDRGRK